MYTGHVCGVSDARGRSRRHFGAVLNVSWGLLEPLWWRLKRSRSRLGRVLGAPGGSWGHCGGILSALGASLDAFYCGGMFKRSWSGPGRVFGVLKAVLEAC